MLPHDWRRIRLIVGLTFIGAFGLPLALLRLAGGQESIAEALGTLPLMRILPTRQTSARAAATTTATPTPGPSAVPPTGTSEVRFDPFEGAYVEGVSQLSGGRSMVRIVVPLGVHGEFAATVTVWQTQSYFCFIPAAYTDKLYCIGPALPIGQRATIEVFQLGTDPGLVEPVFSAEFFVYVLLPTPRPPDDEAGPPQFPTLTPTKTGTTVPSPTTIISATPTPPATVPPSATDSPTATDEPPLPTATTEEPTTAPPSDTPVPTVEADTSTPEPTTVPTDEPTPEPPTDVPTEEPTPP